MQKIAIFPAVPPDDKECLFVSQQVVLRRPAPETQRRAILLEPKAENTRQQSSHVAKSDASATTVEEPAGAKPVALPDGPVTGANESEMAVAASAKLESDLKQSDEKMTSVIPPVFSSLPVASRPTSTCSRRRQSRRTHGQSFSHGAGRGGHWGAVAVLATVAAAVWLAVLAVESQPLGEAGDESQSLRIAAEPESLQSAVGRSMR